MTGPEVRAAMLRLARLVDRGTANPHYVARRLRYLEKELRRRRSTFRAFGTRTKFTPLLRQRIIHFASTHPKWTQQRIAERYNVTNGRVSESLKGKRK